MTLLEYNSKIPNKKRIVFLGDSITAGGLYIAFLQAYFSQHFPDNSLELINLGVGSETVSGLSEPDHPWPRPCVHQRLEAALSHSRPDWVVVCYGMNDGIFYPLDEERFRAYREGMLKLIDRVRQLGAKVILMTPPPFDKDCIEKKTLMPDGREQYSYMAPYYGYNDVLKTYGEWILSIAPEVDGVVNIFEPLMEHTAAKRKQDAAYLSGDGIHPNAEGHWVIANALLRSLFNISLQRMPDYVNRSGASEFFPIVLERHQLLSQAWREHVGHQNPNKAQVLPLNEALLKSATMMKQIKAAVHTMDIRQTSVTSIWKGYEREDFYVNGREAILVKPKTVAEGKPWIWRAEFFDAFAYVDMALLEKGWHIGYYKISNMYGCPYAVELMHSFQTVIESRHGLSRRSVLLGMSRGGLYAVNYATQFPDKVSALYLDAPVLDIRSWPGGKGVGTGDSQCWQECLAIYGLTEASSEHFRENPLDKVDQLVEANIPILIVAGDSDTTVPYEENAAILERNYRKRNGVITVILKPGIGHHPHSLEDPQPITDWILLHKRQDNG